MLLRLSTTVRTGIGCWLSSKHCSIAALIAASAARSGPTNCDAGTRVATDRAHAVKLRMLCLSRKR